MEVSHLIRDLAKVHSAIKKISASGVSKLIAVKPCKIYVPEQYLGTALGSIEGGVRIVGIFAIVVDDEYYGVSSACALVQLEPSTTNIVTVGSEKYLEFSFGIGDTIISNTKLPRTKTLVYRIYNEFIAKGKIPWYINESDLCGLFYTSALHANADLQANSALLELIVTSMMRQKANKFKYYRHDPKLLNLHVKPPYAFIPLNSVAYNASNTTAKLLGGYFNEGLTSALVTPSERNETIETLLRT
jgi:hypothetical protein